MCELFAFSGEHPALLQYSLHEFASHGAGARNADGWGIAHYIEGDVRLLKEASAARDSACLGFIEGHPVRSELVMSHIRHATQGAATVRNCQPFVRELGGAMHVFAHNGDLDRAGLARWDTPEGFRPVGETDSEQAFCALLERLRPLWQGAGGLPEIERRRRVVAAFAQELRTLGPANFIYADGDALFAHGHRRIQVGGGIRPPGLHALCRSCDAGAADVDAPGLRIVPTQHDGAQWLVASVPLTADAGWRALGDGELVVARRGRVLRAPETDPVTA
jgi:predicted glutamine amidotransferase